MSEQQDAANRAHGIVQSQGGHNAGRPAWDEHQHPRHPAGSAAGGEFAPKSGDVPIEPGTTPVPPGVVRGYHYTDDLQNVLKNGLDVAHAKGSTYGEPNGIWMSTQKPKDFKHYVEVFVTPAEIGLNGPDLYPKNSDGSAKTPAQLHAEIAAYNRGNHDFILRIGRVPPERFVTYHEPWHDHYRYIANDPEVRKAVLKGEHDGLLSDPDYGPAIRKIKAMAR